MVRLTRRMLGRASMLILALVLTLGTAVPAFAQDGEGLERQGFSGVVTVLEEGSIMVKTDDGELITVALTEDTQVRLPSGDVQSVLEVELKEGAKVAILAEVGADGSLTALWTLVKPEQPQVEHLLGTIITMEDNRITIVDAQGNEHTVGMPGQALQGLQVGDVATFVVGRPGADDDDDELLVAHGAMTAGQIQQRVAEHASFLQQRVQAGTMPVDDATERIEFLSELMDIHQAHVQGVLTIVLGKVPPQAKAAIESAMERAKIGFDMARAAIQRAGPPEGVGPPPGLGPSDNDNTSDNGKPEWGGPPEGVGPPERAGPPGKPGEGE